MNQYQQALTILLVVLLQQRPDAFVPLNALSTISQHVSCLRLDELC